MSIIAANSLTQVLPQKSKNLQCKFHTNQFSGLAVKAQYSEKLTVIMKPLISHVYLIQKVPIT